MALHLGRTVQELGASLSYAEFLEWQIYFGLEPWGCIPDDQRAALVAATVANANRSADTPPFAVTDFILVRGAEPPAAEPEQALTSDQLADWFDAVMFGLPPEEMRCPE